MAEKRKIESLLNHIAQEQIIPELASAVKITDRSCSESRKRELFDNTVLIAYRRKVRRTCAIAAISSFAVVSLAFALLHHVEPVSESCTDENLYSSLISLPEVGGVSVMTENGSLTIKAPVANVSFNGNYIVLNGSDSVRVSGQGISYLLVSPDCKAIARLQDGTKVTMNSGARMAIPNEFSIRTITFSGEAMFNVTRDEQHPFTVDAGLSRTTVLGTEFLINSFPGDEESSLIALFKGKVMVNFPTFGGDVMLEPSDMVSFKGQNYIKTTGIPDNLTSWCPPEVLELHAPMDAILETVASRYGLNIRCEGDFSGTNCHGRLMLPDNPREFFETLSGLMRIKYSFKNDNTVVISKY